MQYGKCNEGNSIICLCCNCCCSQIRGRTRWDNPDAVAPSNFVPESNNNCITCGQCSEACPMDAITVEETELTIYIDLQKCL